MPNYCYQKLIITCPDSQERIDEFFAYIQGDNPDCDGNLFDFNKIIPMPAELENTISPVRNPNNPINVALRQKYGYDNWYDWKRDNWGTKWGAIRTRREFNDLFFETAWSPAFPVYKKLSELFPDLIFNVTYYDEGWFFAGICNYFNGTASDIRYSNREDIQNIGRTVFGEVYDNDEPEEELPIQSNLELEYLNRTNEE